MVIAAIMAGGTGSRMGSTDTPKQFMMLGSKPIIIHTIEKFFYHPDIEKIVVPCPKPWIGHTKDIVEKYFDAPEKIFVIEGGASRNDTLMNALNFIESEFGMDDDTIILTHDAVRPFLTHRIISENIKYAMEYGACDTVVPATDTIVHSDDRKCISDIPKRSEMYQGQTPQSFKAKKLKIACESLTEEEKAQLTDACMVFVLRNEPVSLVEGEVFNIKITYPYDLKVAQVLLQEKINN